MIRTLTFEHILCSEYERLLDDCQRALAAWDERCECIRKANLSEEDADRELLRLQVRFATSYVILQRHAHFCERCKNSQRINEDLQEMVALNNYALPN